MNVSKALKTTINSLMKNLKKKHHNGRFWRVLERIFSEVVCDAKYFQII